MTLGVYISPEESVYEVIYLFYFIFRTDTFSLTQMTPERPVHILGVHFYLIVSLKKILQKSIYKIMIHSVVNLWVHIYCMFLTETYYYSIYKYIYTQMKVSRLCLYTEHDKFWLSFEIHEITVCRFVKC